MASKSRTRLIPGSSRFEDKTCKNASDGPLLSSQLSHRCLPQQGLCTQGSTQRQTTSNSTSPSKPGPIGHPVGPGLLTMSSSGQGLSSWVFLIRKAPVTLPQVLCANLGLTHTTRHIPTVCLCVTAGRETVDASETSHRETAQHMRDNFI